MDGMIMDAYDQFWKVVRGIGRYHKEVSEGAQTDDPKSTTLHNSPPNPNTNSKQNQIPFLSLIFSLTSVKPLLSLLFYQFILFYKRIIQLLFIYIYQPNNIMYR
ncbi:hypothetical protein ACOSP7_031531 [Xanthoceras sorbifolium]